MRKLNELVQERLNILQDLSDVVKKHDNSHHELLKNIIIEKTLLKNSEKFEFLQKKSLREQYEYILSIASKTPEMMDIQDKLDGLTIVREKKQIAENICPISCEPILTPWISTCGHIFEKKSLFADDKNMRITFCPILGCNAKLVQKKP